MAFDAQPVTAARWPDLEALFDRPIVRTCFCMYYRKTGEATGVGAVNRKAMRELVKAGTVPGLIGYEDGTPVAWVSLGPREDYPKLRRSVALQIVQAYAGLSGIKLDTASVAIGLTAAFADPFVEKLLTPAALGELLRGGWPKGALGDGLAHRSRQRTARTARSAAPA